MKESYLTGVIFVSFHKLKAHLEDELPVPVFKRNKNY